MALSILPNVVLDNVLESLDPKSLFAISLTCVKLHIEANRFLYRYPENVCRLLEDGPSRSQRQIQAGTERRLKSVEESVSRHVTNARTLRIHTSFHVKLLQTIWSQTPLRLSRLRLHSLWFASSNSKEIAECINARHPETHIEQMYLELAPRSGYHGLLGILDAFQNLTFLRLQVSAAYNPSLNPDTIVAELNCQQLKRLLIEFSDIIVRPGDSLPNLEILQMHLLSNEVVSFSEQEATYYTEDDKWRRLIRLMEKEVCFIQKTLSVPFEREIPLLGFVFEHAHRNHLDPAPLAKWLLKSHCRLQDDGLSEISLRRVSSVHRNTALEIMKSFDLEEDYLLEIHLYPDDTPVLARKLPQMITHLELVISASCPNDPVVIPEIIRSLPCLTTVVIRLQGGLLLPSRDWNHVIIQLGDTLATPAYDYLAPINAYKLSAVRENATVWTLSTEPGIDDGSIYLETEVELPGFERGVMDWFSLNPILESVDLYFETDIDYFGYV